MANHWFWLTITIACLVWYSVLTIYVGVKGGFDIKSMLKNLGRKQDEQK